MTADQTTDGRTRLAADTGVPWRTALGVGLLGGAVGALLGGGTGVVTVPALDRLTTLRRATIHGTANLVNVAVAVVGATVYQLRGGHLDLTAGAGLMIGGVTGAFLGARIAARAGDLALRIAFAAVLAVAGAELCLAAAGIGPSSSSPLLPAAVRADVPAVLALTIVAGAVVGGDGTGRRQPDRSAPHLAVRSRAAHRRRHLAAGHAAQLGRRSGPAPAPGHGVGAPRHCGRRRSRARRDTGRIGRPGSQQLRTRLGIRPVHLVHRCPGAAQGAPLATATRPPAQRPAAPAGGG
jgi:hypothetical protein